MEPVITCLFLSLLKNPVVLLIIEFVHSLNVYIHTLITEQSLGYTLLVQHIRK